MRGICRWCHCEKRVHTGLDPKLVEALRIRLGMPKRFWTSTACTRCGGNCRKYEP